MGFLLLQDTSMHSYKEITAQLRKRKSGLTKAFKCSSELFYSVAQEGLAVCTTGAKRQLEF